MPNIWLVAGLIAGVIVVGLPLAIIVLVSMASLREESAHSLAGQAPGAAERIARRVLGFQSEVRFDHARRTLPGTGQHRSGGQSHSGQISPDQRQGAGV